MMELLMFDFIRRAFLVGIALAFILPCIGMIIVLKRLSLVGDTLSHASLFGVILGISSGIHPLLVSVVVCIIAALLMELLRRKIPAFKENAMIIVMSSATALSGIFASKLKNSVAFSSFLFGSIATVTVEEMFLIFLLTIISLIIFIVLYRDLFHIALDERSAKMSGIKVGKVNVIFTLLTAIVVAIASKAVGVLIVSTLLVIPILCAMKLANNYFKTILYAIGLSIVFMIVGLYASYYLDLRPGATIALCAIITYVSLLVVKQ